LPMLETIAAPQDPAPALLAAAAFAAADGRDTDAVDALQHLTTASPSREPRTNIPFATQLAAFRADGFICRYCGKRTVLLPTLRLLSELYPLAFPYHTSWKYGQCHPLYWTHSASCDHLVPVARGGTNGPANLVTACYLCNSLKSGWLLAELAWRLRPRAIGEWDGLGGCLS
jgi:5-methylcytosine-specific restriction endonuclease McrA